MNWELGWLAKMKLEGSAEFDGLLSREDYTLHCEGLAETS